MLNIIPKDEGEIVKINVIKGPMYLEREKLAHEMLYKMISKKANDDAAKQKPNAS